MAIVRLIFTLLFITGSVNGVSQNVVDIRRQACFPKKMPAGNYSGITHLRSTLYAMVDDKSLSDGFRVVDIAVDSISGDILSVSDCGFVSSDSVGNRDSEGLAYDSRRGTVWIVGEADNKIVEYHENGRRTGRVISLQPGVGNGSYESLAYDFGRDLLFTCTESPLPSDVPLGKDGRLDGEAIRLQAFDGGLSKVGTWLYVTGAARARMSDAANYAFGISELLCSDSCLLVLEWEVFVPKKKIGAWVQSRIYVVNSSDMFSADGRVSEDYSERPLPKRLLCDWRTKLTLVSRSFANYEGMCWGPRLVDGSRTIILVSDSQNQSHGVLRDWFRTIVLK